MQPPSKESLEAQRLVSAVAENRQQAKRGHHRITIAIGAMGAGLMGLMCWALRMVDANPATGVPAHVDAKLAYAAYFFWFLAVIMVLGVAGFLNIGTSESLQHQLRQKRVLGSPATNTVHHHHHHNGPEAPPATTPEPDNGEPKITRWTD